MMQSVKSWKPSFGRRCMYRLLLSAIPSPSLFVDVLDVLSQGLLLCPWSPLSIDPPDASQFWASSSFLLSHPNRTGSDHKEGSKKSKFVLGSSEYFDVGKYKHLLEKRSAVRTTRHYFLNQQNKPVSLNDKFLFMPAWICSKKACKRYIDKNSDHQLWV